MCHVKRCSAQPLRTRAVAADGGVRAPETRTRRPPRAGRARRTARRPRSRPASGRRWRALRTARAMRRTQAGAARARGYARGAKSAVRRVSTTEPPGRNNPLEEPLATAWPAAHARGRGAVRLSAQHLCRTAARRRARWRLRSGWDCTGCGCRVRWAAARSPRRSPHEEVRLHGRLAPHYAQRHAAPLRARAALAPRTLAARRRVRRRPCCTRSTRASAGRRR